MRNLPFLLMLSISSVYADSSSILAAPPTTVPGKALWRASMASLTVANVMDVQSSWGKYEVNPALSGPDCKFGARGALIKAGVQGGLMGLEYVITRGHPTKKLYRLLSLFNFSAAGATAAMAAHNYGVARR